MLKFNKVLNSKIVSLIIACVFFLNNTAYGRDISKEFYLRKLLDFNKPNVTSRYLDVLSESQIDNYKRFQNWLGGISQDRLENTVILLELLEIFRKGLIIDPNEDVSKANSETIKALIEQGLVNKEKNVTSEEIEDMFVEVYGRSISASGYYYYYLKFLDILKDDPASAYQIANWNIGELTELFQIFDYFTKGVKLDPGYKADGSEKHPLEKRLIKGSLGLLKYPHDFIDHLKHKIKATIDDSSVKLAIRVYEVASINAARGLIKALDLDKDNVIILYDREIDAEQAERFFPGYNIAAYSGYSYEKVISINFHDYSSMKISFSGGFLSASLSHTPFKFNLPEPILEEDVNNMKDSLGIGSRKIIVVGSPSDTEFSKLMKSYNALYGNISYEKRPLLIIGFRQRRNANELKLLESLSGQSIAVRTDEKAPLPDVKSNNVLILNTSGELLGMYALADIAIVGNDRNIFEPASQKTAVLYFDGNWNNNRDAKDVLAAAEAVQVFSKENLERLMTSPAETGEMANKGLEAVRAYKKEVYSRAEEFALQIIGAVSQARDKFLSVGSVHENEPNLDTLKLLMLNI